MRRQLDYGMNRKGLLARRMADGFRGVCRTCRLRKAKYCGRCRKCAEKFDGRFRILGVGLNESDSRSLGKGCCDVEQPWPSHLPAEPTVAPPGSVEKIAVLAMRAARGEDLWHPEDVTWDDVAGASAIKGLFQGEDEGDDE